MATPSSAERNAINLKMRQTPWYQGWFRAQGLNPNSVTLSDAQRQQLSDAARKNGMPLPDGALIDQAGNVNVKHGFAGQPKWARWLEIGGTIAAADFLSGGSLHAPLQALFTAGAPSAAVASAAPAVAGTTTAGALVAAPTIASAVAPTIAAAAAPAVAKAGFSIADAFKTGFAPALNAATNLYSTRAQTSANDRASQLQVDAINHAADLQAKAAQDALDFTKGEYTAREARLAPYRQAGQEAMTRVSDLVRPGSGAAYLPPPTQYLPARALVGR